MCHVALGAQPVPLVGAQDHHEHVDVFNITEDLTAREKMTVNQWEPTTSSGSTMRLTLAPLVIDCVKALVWFW